MKMFEYYDGITKKKRKLLSKDVAQVAKLIKN
jgi:hypothetical protein